jgi:hypothetical protein
MVDAVVSPTGTGSPSSWTIYELPDHKELGRLFQAGTTFTIMVGKDNFLTGVSLGPYSSKEDALAAIAKKIGGSCTVGP